jgi:hypothetical protein
VEITSLPVIGSNFLSILEPLDRVKVGVNDLALHFGRFTLGMFQVLQLLLDVDLSCTNDTHHILFSLLTQIGVL